MDPDTSSGEQRRDSTEDIVVANVNEDTSAATTVASAPRGDAASDEPFEISVRLLTRSKTFPLQVRGSTSVQEIKAMIQERSGLEPDCITLRFQGHALGIFGAEDICLSRYAVTAGSVIHVAVTRLAEAQPPTYSDHRDDCSICIFQALNAGPPVYSSSSPNEMSIRSLNSEVFLVTVPATVYVRHLRLGLGWLMGQKQTPLQCDLVVAGKTLGEADEMRTLLECGVRDGSMFVASPRQFQ